MLPISKALTVPDADLKRGQIVQVAVLPSCNWPTCTERATYDLGTASGRWGNFCTTHAGAVGIGLGTGVGQRLTTEPVTFDRRAEVAAALASGDLYAIEDAVGDGDLAEYL